MEERARRVVEDAVRALCSPVIPNLQEVDGAWIDHKIALVHALFHIANGRLPADAWTAVCSSPAPALEDAVVASWDAAALMILLRAVGFWRFERPLNSWVVPNP